MCFSLAVWPKLWPCAAIALSLHGCAQVDNSSVRINCSGNEKAVLKQIINGGIDGVIGPLSPSQYRSTLADLQSEMHQAIDQGNMKRLHEGILLAAAYSHDFQKNNAGDLFDILTVFFGPSAQLNKELYSRITDDITNSVFLCKIATNASHFTVADKCRPMEERIHSFLSTDPDEHGDRDVCETLYRLAWYDNYHPE